jgi:WD40 repeat protein
LATLEGHQDRLHDAKFSRDGARLVTSSKDKTARVWDVKTEKTLLVLSGHADSVQSAVFSPDDRSIVTASDDTTARIWDAESGKALATLTGHGFGVNSVVFSPDGKHILTASRDKTARIWDIATRETIATLRGHTHILSSAVYSFDGRRIATASLDDTARVWDVETAKTIAVLPGRTGEGITNAIFSPNDSLVLESEYDGSVDVWRLFPSTDALIDEGRKKVPRCLTGTSANNSFLMQNPRAGASKWVDGPIRARHGRNGCDISATILILRFPRQRHGVVGLLQINKTANSASGIEAVARLQGCR